jgi:hypothetical protein
MSSRGSLIGCDHLNEAEVISLNPPPPLLCKHVKKKLYIFKKKKRKNIYFFKKRRSTKIRVALAKMG